MKKPIIVIGLDAYDAQLMETWMAQGHLKTFNRLRQQGAYGRLTNTVNYCGKPEEIKANDTLWPTFITGQRAHTTGYWLASQYHPEHYTVTCTLTDSGFDYQDHPPFYALGEQYNVAVFDLPYTKLCDQVHGIQAIGWGGHFPYTESVSQPAELLPDLVQRYGHNSILFEDGGHWWDQKYTRWISQAILDSTKTRAAICKDLLQREQWDLFLTVFSEPHAAGHDLYNRSQPDHPLYAFLTQNGTQPDPLLAAYEAIDQSVSDILAAAPEDAYVLCFSPNGMGANSSELLCHAVLPELLFRFNFPGRVALAPGEVGTTPPPMITRPVRNSWMGEMWSKNYEPNPVKRWIKPWIPSQFLRADHNDLASPYPLIENDVAFGWMPVMWYQPLWAQMKAFALPGFTDGYIRINLQGREQQGIVAIEEYDDLCHQLTQLLHRLTDARTGKPLVKQVIRTRQSATEPDDKLPHADLIVIWHDQITDVFDSPDVGRIGPLTYFRPGSHTQWDHGFMVAKGPGIQPGSMLPEGETVDLPPTILSLLGAPIPEHLEGRSLLNTVVTQA